MKIILLNEFIDMCGYFSNHNSGVNNGYNCKHKEQKEYEEVEGRRVGKCYAWSCPMAIEAEEEDFNNPNIDNMGYEYSESQFVITYKGKENNTKRKGDFTWQKSKE